MCLLQLGEIGNDSRLISVLKIHDESIRHTRGPSDQKSCMSPFFLPKSVARMTPRQARLGKTIAKRSKVGRERMGTFFTRRLAIAVLEHVHRVNHGHDDLLRGGESVLPHFLGGKKYYFSKN